MSGVRHVPLIHAIVPLGLARKPHKQQLHDTRTALQPESCLIKYDEQAFALSLVAGIPDRGLDTCSAHNQPNGTPAPN